jgi:hypothetical protein
VASQKAIKHFLAYRPARAGFLIEGDRDDSVRTELSSEAPPQTGEHWKPAPLRLPRTLTHSSRMWPVKTARVEAHCRAQSCRRRCRTALVDQADDEPLHQERAAAARLGSARTRSPRRCPTRRTRSTRARVLAVTRTRGNRHICRPRRRVARQQSTGDGMSGDGVRDHR